MFTKITYDNTAESNMSDVLNDIVAILTGETNKANLSAQVVQEGTTIISTLAAGWTIEETVVAGQDVVLKAPISDDGSKFKYIRIWHITNSNRARVQWTAYESWSSGSGVEVERRWNTTMYNRNSPTYAYALKFFESSTSNTSDQVEVYISASANYLISACKAGASSSKTSGFAMLSEHTRNSAWDTVANGYAPWVLSRSCAFDDYMVSTSFDSCEWFVKPRIPNGIGGDYVPTQSNADYNQHALVTPVGSLSMNTPNAINSQIPINVGMIDESLNTVEALIPFGCQSYKNKSLGGDISAKCEAYLAYLANPGSTGDVFIHNSVNYRIFRFTQGDSGLTSETLNHVLLVKEQ